MKRNRLARTTRHRHRNGAVGHLRRVRLQGRRGAQLLLDPVRRSRTGSGTTRRPALRSGDRLWHRPCPRLPRAARHRGSGRGPVSRHGQEDHREVGQHRRRVRCSEVLEYLSEHKEAHDAVYSIFGAAWFTDPSRLFPLVRQRLKPGGVFVFSQPPAIPGAYGPQGMYKGGFAGKAMSPTATATVRPCGSACSRGPASPRSTRRSSTHHILANFRLTKRPGSHHLPGWSRASRRLTRVSRRCGERAAGR